VINRTRKVISSQLTLSSLLYAHNFTSPHSTALVHLTYENAKGKKRAVPQLQRRGVARVLLNPASTVVPRTYTTIFTDSCEYNQHNPDEYFL
jgi:hypothetical protein